jgi:hypothetical protein
MELNEDERRRGATGQQPEDEKEEKGSAVYPTQTDTASQSGSSGTQQQPAGSLSSQQPPRSAASAAPPRAQHRITIGMHSAPFDEEEALSIMQPARPAVASSASSAAEGAEAAEQDPAAMPSSDNDAVGVVANKTAYYENIDDKQCCIT